MTNQPRRSSVPPITNGLSPYEAGRMVNLSPAVIYHLAVLGIIPCQQSGSERVTIQEPDLMNWARVWGERLAPFRGAANAA